MLILLFTELAKEPRAFKQIRYFADKYDVTTVGYGAPTISGVTHIELPSSVPLLAPIRMAMYALQTVLFRLRWYGLSYRFVSLHHWAWKRLSRHNWDVVIAHDINTVPLANLLRPKRGVIADLHEYAPRQYEHSAEWVAKVAPYYRWICRREVSRAAAVLTVSQGIVDEYERQFGFKPVLVTNATPFADLEPQAVNDPIRLVHSGIAAPPRKLEIMIQAVRDSARPVTLDLYLVPPQDPTYLNSLRELAADDDRIVFRDAVPYVNLVNTLNRYDLGISIIAATTFNHEWSLPNKFFDYVQARLGIVIGPSPEMARVLEEHDLGVVLPAFDARSLTTCIEALSPERVAAWKANAHAAASALSGESQMEILDALLRGLLADDSTSGARR
jgi:hypothetical protein